MRLDWSTLLFGAQLVHLLCNAVVFFFFGCTIVYGHDRVDKIRVVSTCRHCSMGTCRHFAYWIRALGLIYLFTLSLVKAVHAI